MRPPQPFSGSPVRSLQTMLRELSFHHSVLPRLIPDGWFGEHTLEAVMLFQREFHPPVTGHVDYDTWNAIVSQYLQVAPNTPLPRPGSAPGHAGTPIQPGEAHPLLPLVQSMLQSLSQLLEEVERQAVTGIMDEATIRNTRWLQALRGTEVTGALDWAAWDTLVRLYTVFVTFGQTPWLTRPELLGAEASPVPFDTAPSTPARVQ